MDIAIVLRVHVPIDITNNARKTEYTELELNPPLYQGRNVCVPKDGKSTDDARKIEYIGLTVQQVRHVWQAQEQIIKFKVLTDNDTEIEIEINIHGLMVDKIGADFYLQHL